MNLFGMWGMPRDRTLPNATAAACSDLAAEEQLTDQLLVELDVALALL